MSPPKKEKPLRGGAGLRKLTTRQYRVLNFLQGPFRYLFWLIE
jgi:hypothetical protein